MRAYNVDEIDGRLSAVTENYEEFGLPDYMDVVAKMESPRIIKTHLSWEMIPTQIHEKNVKVFILFY